MNKVLSYPGSKWNIAAKLIELIPSHHSYVEPYFGSGAVLFNKPPSDIETVNDLDGEWSCDILKVFKTYRIIAWQPLPEPYQQKGE